MSLWNFLLSLFLFSQQPIISDDLTKIKIFEQSEDSTKNTKTEQIDSTKVENNNFRMSLGGQLGKPAGYNIDLSAGIIDYKGLKTEINSYLKTAINKDDENKILGTIIEIKYGLFSLSSALETDKSSYRSYDTTESSRNLTNIIPNGISWQDIYEQETSDLEKKANKNFYGIGLKLVSPNNEAEFQLSNTSKTTDDKIIVTNNYNEVYLDSMLTNEGIFIVTKDSLLYRILTNNNSLARTKESINRWRFAYERSLNELITLGGGAILQHDKIDYDIRNRTNVTTDINDQVKLIVYGNQTDSTIIPISSHSESQNYSRIVDRDQIDTDMLNLIFHINGTKNPSNRLYFDIGFFNSKDWNLKDIFNFEIKNFNGSLQPYIGSGAFGGRLVLAKQLLPLPLALADYAFENEALSRNVALNDEQKRIIEKYNYYKLLQKVVGPFIDVSLDKIGTDWKFNSKVGYAVNGGYGGGVGIYSYMNEKKINVEALIKNIGLGVYFGYNKDNGNFFGLKCCFGLSSLK